MTAAESTTTEEQRHAAVEPPNGLGESHTKKEDGVMNEEKPNREPDELNDDELKRFIGGKLT